MSKQALSKGFDKEHIYIVEIDVPRCKLVSGVGACSATETGNDKCYNTRSTCTSLADYDEDISPTEKNIYTYKFCKARTPHPTGMNNIAPCINSVSVAPAVVDPNGGIGARASVDVSMMDFPASDRNNVDPYLSERTFDPLETGLFFVKWRRRNENYENYSARVLSGYIVNNTFSNVNFETRHYVLNAMTASNGKAAFKFKDPLQLVSNKRALAPAPSAGKLSTSINAVVTNINIEPSGVGNDEYPTSGVVKIRNEVLTFTRSGDSLTVVRGQFNTVASAHDDGDTVQLCLNYDGSDPVDVVQKDLLVNYAKIPAVYIPDGAWSAETGDFLTSNPNRLITDPTPVNRLIAELCEQWPHKLFWNDRQNQIELVALKAPPSSESNLLTNDKNIMELSVVDKTNLQVSTVFVMYGQFDPTKKPDEKDNYQVTFSRPNLDAIARYDSNNSITVFAPWIVAGNGAAARRIASLKGRRFGIVPRQIDFVLDDKDSETWLGDVRNIIHPDIVDPNGNPVSTPFEITQAAEGDNFKYQALEYRYDAELTDDDEIGTGIVDLPVSENNINLRSKYEAIFGVPDGTTEAKFIVYSGVGIGSSNNANPSIETGSWPSGATITLQVNSGGVVAGIGGNGSSDDSTSGTNGGDAISLGYDLEIINNGTIGGGGGGGGSINEQNLIASGGGGAGVNNGQKGVSDSDSSGVVFTSFSDSVNGSNTQGGAGANMQYTIAGGTEPSQLNGGDGGDLGQAGSSGFSDQTGSGSAGGSAGKAVDLNGFTLTQTVSGNISGLIS